MYGRREQVHAHAFLVDRLVAAVLRTDPDSVDRPLRRTSVGLISGLAVAGVVIAIVLVVGLLTGRTSGKWREPGTLVVNGDTGSRYLLIDGRLRPVLNFASARLLLGDGMAVAKVKSRDLAGTPQGTPIGIPGAPDALPEKSGPQPWTVCAGTKQDGSVVTLNIGDVPGATPAGDRAVLVRAGDQPHLVWRDRRFRVADSWAPRALGLDSASAVSVTPAWLNALPAGPDLGALRFDRGGPGPVVGGQPTTVGQLVQVPDAVGDIAYVVTRDGLVPVTATVSALVAANPAAQDARPLEITPAQLAGQQVLPPPPWQAELPSSPPTSLDTKENAPCVRWQDDRAALFTAPLPSGPARGADPAGVTRDDRVADRIEIALGAGLLVRTRPAPGVAGEGIYLVTESGAKFPVANPDSATALGLSLDSAQPVPADLLALLPTGPVLNRIT
ncbi:type VII secretion protein EccB [Lentzea roselyniae]|uniref:Type VII secretion protein EccB n=1 Tax=Lentzea roselyniae TaxID=531940 RepID=A0ABP7C596_9PSEU